MKPRFNGVVAADRALPSEEQTSAVNPSISESFKQAFPKDRMVRVTARYDIKYGREGRIIDHEYFGIRVRFESERYGREDAEDLTFGSSAIELVPN